MSGGGKGGSQTQTSEVQIPKWLEGEARQNIDTARDVAGLGYVPYYGPDVAAFTPMQNAAFDNTNAAAGAFGMAPGGSGMPDPTVYANGVSGYSSAPLYEQSLRALQQNAPGQYDAITGMFIDPLTGAAPGGGAAGGAAPQQGYANPAQAFMAALQGGASGADLLGGNYGYGPRAGNSQMNGVPVSGAYSGFGDMVNGGGPGAAGGAFQGGGYLSNAGNAVTGRDGGGGQGGK
jgi:hypothetical protein